ncbi:DUF4124 domain-containing protein [Bacterioplanoides sp.]|uniref:DUF4124 domain-containing protein n=1 Tax=Bacterioplanoides sp. TaxID=2066072 RepID=UPI003B00D4EA
MRYGWLLISVMIVSIADAELYRWQDEHGRWQFSDKPPPSNANPAQVEQLNLPSAMETQSVRVESGSKRRKDSNDWLKKEQDAYQQKKDRRLKQEKQQRRQQKQQEACRAARDKYRSIQNSFYRASSPNTLNKRRERLDKQKRRIKASCG